MSNMREERKKIAEDDKYVSILTEIEIIAAVEEKGRDLVVIETAPTQVLEVAVEVEIEVLLEVKVHAVTGKSKNYKSNNYFFFGDSAFLASFAAFSSAFR